jgi:hypothetical protein
MVETTTANERFAIRITNGKKEIFDPIRCRFVLCTPEEAVRQTYIRYLMNVLQVPSVAISVEKKITYNNLTRRYDIVVFSKEKCLLVVECKSPTIKLSEITLQQIGVYNSHLQAKYIILFNGKQEIIYKKIDEKYVQEDKLPLYGEMSLY